MDKSEAIAHILHKLHGTGSLTPEEQDALSAWLKESPEHEVIFQSLLDESLALSDLQEFMALDVSSSWNKIVVATTVAAHETSVLQPKKTYWKRYLAAATLAGLVGAGAWLWSGRHITNPVDSSMQQPMNDIPPGGNKAVLTLANGARVVLDSLGYGVVAHQGNVIISKTDSGQLAYKALDLSHKENLYNTLSTPKAGQFQLVLPDGTKVWLNNASSLRYPALFSDDTREVELTGEAYFEIARDPAKPFKVKVNAMIVEVLGTNFNISAYGDETAIKTTLISGGIRVSKNNKTVDLHPGEQAQLINPGEFIVKKDVDIDAVISWKDGYFTFDKADVRTMMRQLARWYDLDIKYEGDPPARIFGGSIGRELNLSQVLEILRKNDFHLKVEGRTITVSP